MRDSLVFFVFTLDFYQIYDSCTSFLLFQGQCKDGLYPLSFSSKTSTISLCSCYCSLTFLAPLSWSPISTCKDFALSKSTQLAFPINNNYAPSFYLTHSDVWICLVSSVSGYHYYVLFMNEFSRYSWIYPLRCKNEVLLTFKFFSPWLKIHFTLMLCQIPPKRQWHWIC